MKVYELAKQLEVTSVFLMNKIKKEWKLPVKNHMEMLSPALVKKIQDKFYQKSTEKPLTKKISTKKASSKKTETKKTSTKKTTSKKNTTQSKKTKRSITLKKTAKKEVKTVKKVLVKKTQAEPQQEKPAVSKAPQRKIIIRRKEEEKAPSKISVFDKTASPAQKDGEAVSPKVTGSKSMRLDLVSVKSTDPLDESFWNQPEESPTPEKKTS